MPDDTPMPIEPEALIALDELLAASGLAHQEVIELVEYGVFQPAGSSTVWTFHSHAVLVARRAARLRDDFGLNTPGMALALSYLERIEALELRLRELEASLPS